jgi:hypothetical protein
MASVQLAFSANQLSINTLGELIVSDNTGKALKTLGHGSVGEVIRTDEQSFKISYGKNLQGNATVILYASPEEPRPLAFIYNGKEITLTSDAVLTIVFDDNGGVLQSGVLGQVTVDNEKISPASRMRISNSGTLIANVEPIAPAIVPGAASAPAAAGGAYIRKSRGPIGVGITTGGVYISNDGGAEQPLTDNSEVKIGSVIRTEANSSVNLNFFPDTDTLLHEKSLLTVKEYNYNNTPGAPTRHVVLYLHKGKVQNDLNVKDNGAIHYQVDTPHQNFVAIGTNFLVTVDETEASSFVQVYEGIVSANDGSKIYARVQGLYTNTGRPPEFTPMPDEIRREYDTRRYAQGRPVIPNQEQQMQDKNDIYAESQKKLTDYAQQVQEMLHIAALKPITPVTPR